MTQPFAFNVAIVEKESGVLGTYDSEKQQFVWVGDGEASLGNPLCSVNSGGYGYSDCTTTSTQCYFGGIKCTPLDCNRGYTCDYG